MPLEVASGRSGAPLPLSPEPAPVCTAPAASPRHADLVTLCVRPWLGPTRQGALPWSAGPGLGPLSAFLLGLPVVSRLSPQGAVLCVRGPPPSANRTLLGPPRAGCGWGPALACSADAGQGVASVRSWPISRCPACVLRAGVQAPCVFITPLHPAVRGGVVTPAVTFSIVFTESFSEEGF